MSLSAFEGRPITAGDNSSPAVSLARYRLSAHSGRVSRILSQMRGLGNYPNPNPTLQLLTEQRFQPFSSNNTVVAIPRLYVASQ